MVIQHRYPELHKILQQRPKLLIDLEQFYRENENDGSETKEHANNQQLPLSTQVDSDRNIDPALQPFISHEDLARMFLLHPIENSEGEELADEDCFASLSTDEVAIYFTLTSRAEAPKPEAVETKPAQPTYGKSTSLPSEGTFGDRYRIEYELGRGGMAVVYLVEDQRLQRRVALKKMSVSLLTDRTMQRRFERELKVLSQFDHPNLVRIFDVGYDGEQPFYVMNYLPGGSLKDKMRRIGIFSNEDIKNYILPILDAIEYIHQQGVIHRDIKPSAILFDADDHPVLTDLGISKIFSSDEELTATGAIIGTPAYMSPEQFQGNANIDQRTDLYSFGILLFECLTGQLPFTADTPAQIMMMHVLEPTPSPLSVNPDISNNLDQIIMKLLAKDPNDRYQTTIEVKEALSKVL